MNKIFFFLSIVFLTACNKKNAPQSDQKTKVESELSAKEQEEIKNIQSLSQETGFQRLQTNCFPCHNPKAESHDEILATPLAGIKHNYKNLYPDEELFITKMASFVNDPNEENAIMRGPIRRFGLMPKTTLSKKEIQELVQYIYHNDIEFPDWFPEHFEEHHNTNWTEKS